MGLPEGWRETTLAEVATSLQAGVSVRSVDRRRSAKEKAVLKTSAVTYGVFDPSQHKTITEDRELERARTSPRADHVVISRMNTPRLVGASAYVAKDEPNLFLPDRLWQFTASSKDVSCLWLSYLLGSPSTRSVLSGLASGSSASMKNISKGKLRGLRLSVPPLGEQRKIAAILSSVDEAIEKTQAVIEQVQVVKRGLMQELLTKGLPGRHKRFKQTEIGQIPADWDVCHVSDILDRVREPVDVETRRMYREVGVRSHGKGVFHKDEVPGSKIGGKKVFWVVPGALVINIVFAWERAVAKTSEAERGFICSHRFPMYLSKGHMLVDFVFRFFVSARGNALLRGISPGGAGRNKTMSQSGFMKLPVPVPPMAEQRDIVQAFREVEERTRKEQSSLKQFQELKKALMSVLLTGELRVTPTS